MALNLLPFTSRVVSLLSHLISSTTLAVAVYPQAIPAHHCTLLAHEQNILPCEHVTSAVLCSQTLRRTSPSALRSWTLWKGRHQTKSSATPTPTQLPTTSGKKVSDADSHLIHRFFESFFFLLSWNTAGTSTIDDNVCHFQVQIW